MKTSKHSAAGIKNDLNTANAKNKPVVNSSKNRLYDLDGDFRDIQDWKETKTLAKEILLAVAKAKRKDEYLWINGVQLRRKIVGDRIRLWDSALALLCDDIEIKNPLIPHFRYCKREMKPPMTRQDGSTALFRQYKSNEVLPELKK